MNPLDWDWDRIKSRLATFRGTTLLFLFIAGVLNIAVGLIPLGVVFIVVAILLAIRLVTQEVDESRGPRRF